MIDASLQARSHGLSAPTEPALSPEFLRLLRCLTSPLFEEQGRMSTNPSSHRVGRFECLNDVSGRTSRVFRKSPCPPHCRTSSTNAPEPTEARNAQPPRCFDRQGRVASHPPLDREGRHELLNDVTGRERRVFRKSPCPPRSRRFSDPSV